MQPRVKQIIRTVSKVYGFADPAKGLYLNQEVEEYVSKFINDGWELMLVEVVNKAVAFGDNQNAGVEMLYVLVLPEDKVPVEESDAPKRRGRPPKEE